MSPLVVTPVPTSIWLHRIQFLKIVQNVGRDTRVDEIVGVLPDLLRPLVAVRPSSAGSASVTPPAAAPPVSGCGAGGGGSKRRRDRGGAWCSDCPTAPHRRPASGGGR